MTVTSGEINLQAKQQELGGIIGLLVVCLSSDLGMAVCSIQWISKSYHSDNISYN